jgi:uridine kinase
MNKPFIIGIAGGSGSGKTFFLKCFLKHFSDSEVCLVSQDDYYFPVPPDMTAEENKHFNFDLPDTIDHQHFEDDIQSLLAGRSIIKKEYTFNNPSAIPKMLEIKSAPIIIVEGLFILHFKKIAEQLDLKIFMMLHFSAASNAI